MNKTLKQYLIALGFGLLFTPLFEVTIALLPDIGWHFLTVLYIEILLFQVVFYYLTMEQKIGWTILSYIINFVLWTAVLVILEKTFGEISFNNGSLSKYTLSVLGALLWATNKIFIDSLIKATTRQNILD